MRGDKNVDVVNLEQAKCLKRSSQVAGVRRTTRPRPIESLCCQRNPSRLVGREIFPVQEMISRSGL